MFLDAEEAARREQEQKARDAACDEHLQAVQKLFETPLAKEMLAKAKESEEGEVGGDMKPTTLFPSAVPENGPKEDEDLKARIAELELENEDLKDKQRALTVPKGSVGLSEVHPSALNQSGRAKKAEAKHVEAKTKRRQQDEQDKAMMKQRYVPKPTPRLTRSRAAAKK